VCFSFWFVCWCWCVCVLDLGLNAPCMHTSFVLKEVEGREGREEGREEGRDVYHVYFAARSACSARNQLRSHCFD